MKKNVIRNLFVLVLGIFMLVPCSVNANLEKEWKYDIDLSNSVSSSIVKLEDGIAVMNYEGNASSNNTIIKLSYDGKVVNSIKNEYGYNMSSFDGGLLVYTATSNSKITKLDKDLNVVWTVDTSKGVSDAVDLNEGFAGCTGYQLTVYDDNGNSTGNIVVSDIAKNLFGDYYYFISYNINKSLDGENIIVFLEMRSTKTGYNSGIGIIVFSKQLEVVSSYKADLSEFDLYEFNGITETAENYIASGFKTVVMSKDGKIEKKMSTSTFDVTYLNKNIYAYTLNQNDFAYSYDSSFSKYTSKFDLIGSKQLPLSFEMIDTGGSTGISAVKKRAIFYEKDNDVKVIVLNTPLIDPNKEGSGSCTVTQYRVGDFTDECTNTTTNNNTNNDSGIINNITSNPQTNSIVVIVVFVVLIIVVCGIYYFLYKRKATDTK